MLTPTPPPAEASGFRRTLNGMGFMTSTLDPYSLAFIDHAARYCPAQGTPGALQALEIGAAYGIATLQALKAGAKVIANDLDANHLRVLKAAVPEENKAALTLLPGHFPEEVALAPASIQTILICRVLHFFTPQHIELAAQKIFEWLTPGGKVFVITDTPYLKGLEAFLPTYEARKQSGDPWPGLIPDLTLYGHPRTSAVPQMMNLLDPPSLSRVFHQAGFEIEVCQFFERADYPKDLRQDGREGVGLIARKPMKQAEQSADP